MKRCLLSILPFVLVACLKVPGSKATVTPAGEHSSVAGTTPENMELLTRYHWLLADASADQNRGRKLEVFFPGDGKTLQLNFVDGGIRVSGGCNGLSGKYSLKNGKLTVPRMLQTLMGCPPKLEQADEAIKADLAKALALEIRRADAPTLVLRTPGPDAHVLTFIGEPTADTRYGGPGEIVFLEVAAQTKPCSHPLVPDKQCLQVRELERDDKGIKTDTNDAFENFYSDIEGYVHKPGIRNVLGVKRYTIKNPPADGNSIVYVLGGVVRSENVEALKPAP